MSLRSLLRKELYWSRRNALALAFVLLVLPGFFAASSVLFEDVLPRDAPVAVVAQDDAVSPDELATVHLGVAAYADSRLYESTDAALDALERERVYAVVSVPPGLGAADGEATFRFYVDGSIVPFKSPSTAIAAIMERALDDLFQADVAVERVVVGNDHDLSTYLVPIFLLGVVMLFALTYVPHNLAQESAVLDRIRLESSMEALVGSKLIYFSLLALVPIVVFQLASYGLGYDVSAVAPGAVAALLLTFVTLAAVGMAVMIVTGFDAVGRFVNVVLLMGVLGFSGLAYPVGYFSPVRKAIVRAMPTHYATIVTRSSMLKDSAASTFADWLVGLVVVAVLAVLALKLAVVYDRRRT